MGHGTSARMADGIDYLLEEVRALRDIYTATTGRKGIPFTDERRRRLATEER